MQYEELLQQYEYVSDEAYFLRAEHAASDLNAFEADDGHETASGLTALSTHTFPLSKPKENSSSNAPEAEESSNNDELLLELRRSLHTAASTTQVRYYSDQFINSHFNRNTIWN